MNLANNFIPKPYECEYCFRSFSQEKTLISHNCEKKRRMLNKDDPESRLGFFSYQRFYQLTSKHAKNKKTYKDFAYSKFYSSFVRFGRHLVQTNPLNTEEFIDFLIKKNVPLENWIKEHVYETYVKEKIKNELPLVGFERTIHYIKEWSQINNEDWLDFFKKINPNLACFSIASGRISPWVFYNAQTSNLLFERFNSEQLKIIAQIAPPPQWKIKFINNKKDTQTIKNTLEEFGL